jgi:hypothetical protein
MGLLSVPSEHRSRRQHQSTALNTALASEGDTTGAAEAASTANEAASAATNEINARSGCAGEI